MQSVRIHKVFSLMISFFHLIGYWHKGDKPTIKQQGIKIFYYIYYLPYFMSLVIGAILSDKVDQSVFLVEISFGVFVILVKLWFLIWKQDQILDLMNRVCEFSIQIDDDYKRFNEKLSGFIKFVLVFVIAVTCIASVGSVVLPFVGSKKTLVLEIAFPLDYNNDEIAFWLAATFIFTEFILVIFPHFFSAIIWYILLCCSLRYEVLRNELKFMGSLSRGEHQMVNKFGEDLRKSIEAHIHLKELVRALESFFSDLFFIQFGTSGLSICGSIYCLAYDKGDNVFASLLYILMVFYFISELFMITYFGNEIMLSSSRLSYSLFESDWYNQPESTKKLVLIFGECLKRPQKLMIGKLYPLTFETFTRILNSIYGMFNILKRFRQ